jgi:hypothetical protein
MSGGQKKKFSIFAPGLIIIFPLPPEFKEIISAFTIGKNINIRMNNKIFFFI